MSFDETVIWKNDRARPGELAEISWKDPRAAGSKSLRSVTSWVWETKDVFVTRHLYLSDHHDKKNGVAVPRFRYFENRKNRRPGPPTRLATDDDVLDPMAAALLVTYGDEALARTKVAEALAEAIPLAMLEHVPTEGTTGLQRLLAARYPLLRHLAETQGVALPEQIPARFARLLGYRTALDAIRSVAGQDGASRPAAAELGRLLVVDGQVRTREVSMLVAARGLPRDVITDIVRDCDPVGDGSAFADSGHTRAAARHLGELGTQRHRREIADLLGREDGHERLEQIGRDQLVELPRRRGPFDELDGLEVPGTGKRLRVLYPGDDADLVTLGTQMRNCIRHYVRDGPMPFTDGAIVAVVDGNGRATHAIEIDPQRRVTTWQGRGNTLPPAVDREQVAQLLTAHGITAPTDGLGDDLQF